MSRINTPFADMTIKAIFQSFPASSRQGLFILRELIFSTAKATPGVGRLEETLKWGQPAYLTPETKSGSTIRLGMSGKSWKGQGSFALFAHCQTSLLRDFQAIFPDGFTYEGNRAIHFCASEELPLDKLELLIRNALTYHLRKD